MPKRSAEEKEVHTNGTDKKVKSEVKVKKEPEFKVKLEPGLRIIDVSSSAPAPSSSLSSRNPLKTEHGQRLNESGDIICPYLDTIDRKILDFDFEKLCSVSLVEMNVYACLICGKYFQGRGKNTHAYTHALESGHRVFINLETEKIYCLPDGYEVRDSSLSDIVYNLHPTFSKASLKRLDTNIKYTHALDGTDYLPGVVGLNNTKSTDWLNVIVQALCRVPPIRDFFIIEDNWGGKSNPNVCVKRFGELVAKLWNGKAFKGHVSPHELLQAVSTISKKEFKIGTQSDPLKFLCWFLHQLHKDLGGKKKKKSIVKKTFEGEIEITTLTPTGRREAKKEDEEEGAMIYTSEVSHKKFLYLSLELPAAPLFQDSLDANMIPQVPLFDLLSKFDGEKEEIMGNGQKKKYTLSKLPRYLIVHARRFKANNWFVEKNPTLVNFPIRNLDMKLYMTHPDAPKEADLEKMSVSELKKHMKKKGLDASNVVEKKEMVKKLADVYADTKIPSKYDLIANVVHDGKPDKGTYRCHVYAKGTDTWFELQDLHVYSTETMPQLVALSETYIQVYELQKPS